MGIDTFDKQLVAQLPLLKRFAISLCRNVEVADDLVQEIVLRALSDRDGFDGRNLSAWLLTILRNHYFSLRRSSYVKTTRDRNDDDIYHLTDEWPRPDAILIAREEFREVEKATDAKDQSLVLALAEEDSYRELAERFSILEGTVKSRVNRLRIKLRQATGRPFPSKPILRKDRRMSRGAWRSYRKHLYEVQP